MSIEKDTKYKGIEKELPKVSPRTNCYKCQGYGHVAANCPSLVRITIIGETFTKNSESDFKEIAYQPNKEVDDDSDFDQENDGVEFNYI